MMACLVGFVCVLASVGVCRHPFLTQEYMELADYACEDMQKLQKTPQANFDH
jgi:hypothetical protein